MTEPAEGPRPQSQALTPYLTVANAAGAIEFYGRAFDHEWSIGTRVEGLSSEERGRRFQEAFGAPAPA
jgi:uncharacterized glyoxalase superfamily protein PhnB